jgi:hypothetical protein
MANPKSAAALLGALVVFLGNTPGALRAQGWPGNDPPRLEITQTLNQSGPGKSFGLDLGIHNRGTSAARSILIVDNLPEGVELLEAAPVPVRQQGLLTWSLVTLKPGEQYPIRLRLRATDNPPIAGWANKIKIVYQAELGKVCAIDPKLPKIELSVAAPKNALLGERLPLEISVRNTGTWTGHHLNLTARVTGGLTHDSGGDLENTIGDLPPGQSCTLSLPLTAWRIGKGLVQLRLTAEETRELGQSLAIDIHDVRIDLKIQGPSTAYAGWPCTYNFVVSNQGSEMLPATDLIAEMPKTLTFVRASGNGSYQPKAHAVVWHLPECKAGESLTCVLSGASQDVPGADGFLKVVRNNHVITGIPWSLRLLERSSTASPRSATADTPGDDSQKR